MRFGFPQRVRLLLVPASAVLLFVMAGCGNSSIVGKWRMSGTENQTVWEFSGNGSVLVGEVRGRYKFGDQDRLKIETPFATTVYLVNTFERPARAPGPGRFQARIHKGTIMVGSVRRADRTPQRGVPT